MLRATNIRHTCCDLVAGRTYSTSEEDPPWKLLLHTLFLPWMATVPPGILVIATFAPLPPYSDLSLEASESALHTTWCLETNEADTHMH
jgi:hypothetical protein